MPATPLVTYDYDRLGRRSRAVQNGVTTAFGHNDANLPLTESYSGGILNGLSVNQTYFNTLKRDALSLGKGINAYGAHQWPVIVSTWMQFTRLASHIKCQMALKSRLIAAMVYPE